MFTTFFNPNVKHTKTYTYGCTDKTAKNYDSSANKSDNSCVYPVYGCTNTTAVNYNTSATDTDGSCQFQKSKIVLNKALVYYPLECLHYVVLHEYLHLIVPNHSKRFHELMAYHMPDYKKIKYLLNNYPLSDIT